MFLHFCISNGEFLKQHTSQVKLREYRNKKKAKRINSMNVRCVDHKKPGNSRATHRLLCGKPRYRKASQMEINEEQNSNHRCERNKGGIRMIFERDNASYDLITQDE